MKQRKLICICCTAALFFLQSNSFLQNTTTADNSVYGIFESTTPCDDAPRKILSISPAINCEMMRWHLTLNQHPESKTPSTFLLSCVYGMARQNTRGFISGADTIRLHGKWSNKSVNGNEMIILKAENRNMTITMRKFDDNLLHLADNANNLLTGNGAWSYSLNRVNPIPVQPSSFTKERNEKTPVGSVLSSIGTFDCRAPCDKKLLQLSDKSAAGCNIIKLRLTLYQDSITHTPSSFLINKIYVGKGDTRYENTGKWEIVKGKRNGSDVIIYKLHAYKDNLEFNLLKGDNNLLFFLDENMNFQVGDYYTSFTLNRVKN
jgi:hypothetical protein